MHVDYLKLKDTDSNKKLEYEIETVNTILKMLEENNNIHFVVDKEGNLYYDIENDETEEEFKDLCSGKVSVWREGVFQNKYVTLFYDDVNYVGMDDIRCFNAFTKLQCDIKCSPLRDEHINKPIKETQKFDFFSYKEGKKDAFETIARVIKAGEDNKDNPERILDIIKYAVDY